MWIVKTPARVAFSISKNEYLLSNFPAIMTAGIYARIYPNPYSKKYASPPPNANIGKKNPNKMYIKILASAILRPKKEQINIIVGICGIMKNLNTKSFPVRFLFVNKSDGNM